MPEWCFRQCLIGTIFIVFILTGDDKQEEILIDEHKQEEILLDKNGSTRLSMMIIDKKRFLQKERFLQVIINKK